MNKCEIILDLQLSKRDDEGRFIIYKNNEEYRIFDNVFIFYTMLNHEEHIKDLFKGTEGIINIIISKNNLIDN